MKERDRRNVNPHKPARFAMAYWGHLYAEQSGGSMDFWATLTPSKKKFCREVIAAIEKARPEFGKDGQ